MTTLMRFLSIIQQRRAAAFACRFYLFYGKYEQALSYAGAAIDEDPSSSLRNLKSYTILTQSGEWRDRFISKDEPANLLLVALRSRWGRNYTTQRYGNSDNIVNLLIYRSSGPWGKLWRILTCFSTLQDILSSHNRNTMRYSR